MQRWKKRELSDQVEWRSYARYRPEIPGSRRRVTRDHSATVFPSLTNRWYKGDIALRSLILPLSFLGTLTPTLTLELFRPAHRRNIQKPYLNQSAAPSPLPHHHRKSRPNNPSDRSICRPVLSNLRPASQNLCDPPPSSLSPPSFSAPHTYHLRPKALMHALSGCKILGIALRGGVLVQVSLGGLGGLIFNGSLSTLRWKPFSHRFSLAAFSVARG